MLAVITGAFWDPWHVVFQSKSSFLTFRNMTMLLFVWSNRGWTGLNQHNRRSFEWYLWFRQSPWSRLNFNVKILHPVWSRLKVTNGTGRDWRYDLNERLLCWSSRPNHSLTPWMQALCECSHESFQILTMHDGICDHWYSTHVHVCSMFCWIFWILFVFCWIFCSLVLHCIFMFFLGRVFTRILLPDP